MRYGQDLKEVTSSRWLLVEKLVAVETTAVAMANVPQSNRRLPPLGAKTFRTLNVSQDNERSRFRSGTMLEFATHHWVYSRNCCALYGGCKDTDDHQREWLRFQAEKVER
jgi:hypothetical protein